MAGQHVLEINESNFDAEVLGSDIPVVIDFWAAWCGPCRAVSPLIDQLATQYDGKVRVGKINVDDNPNLAAKYKITGIPAFLAFKGGDVADRLMGAHPKKINDLFQSVSG